MLRRGGRAAVSVEASTCMRPLPPSPIRSSVPTAPASHPPTEQTRNIPLSRGLRLRPTSLLYINTGSYTRPRTCCPAPSRHTHNATSLDGRGDYYHEGDTELSSLARTPKPAPRTQPIRHTIQTSLIAFDMFAPPPRYHYIRPILLLLLPFLSLFTCPRLSVVLPPTYLLYFWSNHLSLSSSLRFDYYYIRGIHTDTS